ncbi:ArsR/SmtB family transcription factor [Nonomuraea sp. NPDC049480]|uniref:ArsR/SmtB family transcription factor n=1 Tax=Nonomuraea sp. NPDC049480 TaxID=3364353 RepID=UPI0037B0A1DF
MGSQEKTPHAVASYGFARTPESLGTSLGPARAGVLILLETPKTSTQLVAMAGHGRGSAGRHLKIMLDAGLIQRRRAGRSVFCYRADAGEVLVKAACRWR